MARVAKAEAHVAMALTGTIMRASAGGQWEAARWWLSVRRRKHFGQKTNVELSGNPKRPVRIAGPDVSKLSDTDLEQLEAILARATAKPE